MVRRNKSREVELGGLAHVILQGLAFVSLQLRESKQSLRKVRPRLRG
jgi:hypothetical protein